MGSNSPFLVPYYISIYFSRTTFDYMATCSKEKYQSVIEYDECDYQPANATFGNVTEAIEIRRKGHSTWTDMDQKPSFKIKMESDVDFGRYECDFYGRCNHWKTDKLTLNNQFIKNFRSFEYVPNDEEYAYQVFREIGIKAPLARRASVTIYIDDIFFRRDDYSMIETIKDKTFIEKHWGVDVPITLWEIEKGETECKKAYNGGQECSDTDLRVINLAYPTYANLPGYLKGEVLLGHWDGVCFNNGSNIYIVNESNRFYIVPHGLDWTFQNCKQSYEINISGCAPYQSCFGDNECYDLFKETTSIRTTCSVDCLSTLEIVGIVAGALFGTGLLVFIVRMGLEMTWGNSKSHFYSFI